MEVDEAGKVIQRTDLLGSEGQTIWLALKYGTKWREERAREREERERGERQSGGGDD